MNDYEEKQRLRDAQYEAAWKNLTPAQRKRMAKLGITGPEKPIYHTSKRDEQAAIERQGVSFELYEELPTTPLAPHSEEQLLATVRKLLGELMSQDNIRLTLECFALVTNIQYDGESMTRIADRFSITRAAVSKRCVELTEALGLPPPRAMKGLTARKTYGKRARKCHSRNGH